MFDSNLRSHGKSTRRAVECKRVYTADLRGLYSPKFDGGLAGGGPFAMGLSHRCCKSDIQFVSPYD